MEMHAIKAISMEARVTGPDCGHVHTHVKAGVTAVASTINQLDGCVCAVCKMPFCQTPVVLLPATSNTFPLPIVTATV